LRDLADLLESVQRTLSNYSPQLYEQMKQIDMINFTKNMALVGALLMFLLLPRPWPMGLGIG